MDVIGTAYDLGPEGAIFDRPLVMKLAYDEALIPDGLTEQQLAAGFWVRETEKWEPLESSVDPVSNTVTAPVSHFTIFAVIAPVRAPAFALSGLTCTPEETVAGESVTVSVVVTNTGDLEGDYPVVMKVNDAHEETIVVTLAGGANQTVTFSVPRSEPGMYTVEIGDLPPTTFVIKRPAPPPTEPTTPDRETPAADLGEPETHTPVTESEPPGVSGLLVGVVAGVVVLSAAVVGIIWRRRDRQQPDPDAEP